MLPSGHSAGKWPVCQANSTPLYAPFSPVRLPSAGMPVYLELASSLETIVEDLKSLPPEKLEAAADFIRQLKPISPEERQVALDRTFGCLSKEEADELERAIEEGCEHVTERGW